MKLLFVLTIVIVLALGSSAQITTDFCGTADDCCAQFSDCVAALAAMPDDISTAIAYDSLDLQACEAPLCPLGYAQSSGSQCAKISEVTGALNQAPAILDNVNYLNNGNPVTSPIVACLIRSEVTSYKTRHCLEGVMQQKRACMFHLGIKG
jgi:hypothetical protein